MGRRAALCAAVLVAGSLSVLAEPVAHDASEVAGGPQAEAGPAMSPAVDLLGEVVDTAGAAEKAAHEAVLQQQAIRDRHAATLQTYLGRPPTWIQTAAGVNLAEFPAHADPTGDAEQHLRTLEWLLEQRSRMPIAAVRTTATDPASLADDEPTWLDVLLPSTWLPLLREHRDNIVATGVALLLSSWLLSSLLKRAARRTRRWRRTRRHRHGQPHRDRVGHAAQSAPTSAAEAPSVELEPRHGRRRRRRRRPHSGADPDTAIAWSARETLPRA